MNRRAEYGNNNQYKMRKSASGMHLFNRTTGVNILLDEARIPESEWMLAPRNVSIALTNRCDLRCPFCFAPKNESVLDLKQVKNWLRELDMNGSLGVGFGGGEPTLHPDFVQLCRFASEETNLAVSFTTHGWALDKERLDALVGNVHFIRVSVAGVGAVYERMRNRPLSGFLNPLESLWKSGICFGVNMLVNAMTIGCLDDVAELAKQYGAMELLLLPEIPVNGGCGCSGKILEHLHLWVQTYRGDLRLAISENSSEGFPVCEPLPEECGLRAFAHIDAGGILKRTSFDKSGVLIDDDGVIAALAKLKQQQGGA
jgi:MoaA/NifB/PqqE/SkfB family radical SAM enzyme